MTAAIRTPQDIKKLGTILSVWAHPDDETWCAAGIMATAVTNGQRVVCVLATKGEAGVQNERRWPRRRLGEIRAHEFENGAKILGLSDHHWLDCRDGGCDQVSDDAGSAKIKAFIDTHLPDTILTFGPDGMTGHPDHQAISRWVDQAVEGSNIAVYQVVEEEQKYHKYMKLLDKQFNFYFNIHEPPFKAAEDCDIAFQLSPELINKKCDALKAMPSQTEAMFKNSPPGLIESALTYECFVLAR